MELEVPNAGVEKADEAEFVAVEDDPEAPKTLFDAPKAGCPNGDDDKLPVVDVDAGEIGGAANPPEEDGGDWDY